MNKIKRNEDEPIKRYELRKLFISLIDGMNIDLKILYSNIFVNNIYLGCKYSKEIEKNLDEIINKNKTKIKKLLNNFNNNKLKNFITKINK